MRQQQSKWPGAPSGLTAKLPVRCMRLYHGNLIYISMFSSTESTRRHFYPFLATETSNYPLKVDESPTASKHPSLLRGPPRAPILLYKENGGPGWGLSG